jgi:hypothetical protein
MMTDTPESVTLVPIDRIEVLNSRDRNMKVFEEIVENIRTIGLKKPITVTEREGADGTTAYLLVCGEGRLNAFRLLGESHIPALVVIRQHLARPGLAPIPAIGRDREWLIADHVPPHPACEAKAIAADPAQAGLIVIGRAEPCPRCGDNEGGIGGYHSTFPSWPPSWLA